MQSAKAVLEIYGTVSKTHWRAGCGENRTPSSEGGNRKSSCKGKLACCLPYTTPTMPANATPTASIVSLPQPGSCRCSGRTKGRFGTHSCYRPAHPPRPCLRAGEICSLHSPGRGGAASGDGPALLQNVPTDPWLSSATRGSRSELQGLWYLKLRNSRLERPSAVRRIRGSAAMKGIA